MTALRLVAIALLTALPATSPADPQPPSQTVTLFSHGYAPEVLRLAAGKPVTLIFHNRSGSAHDFTARAFFRASRIVAGTVDDGEIELAPGARRSITLIPSAGRYRVHCGHFFHKQLGMRGTIIVD